MFDDTSYDSAGDVPCHYTTGARACNGYAGCTTHTRGHDASRTRVYYRPARGTSCSKKKFGEDEIYIYICDTPVHILYPRFESVCNKHINITIWNTKKKNEEISRNVKYRTPDRGGDYYNFVRRYNTSAPREPIVVCSAILYSFFFLLTDRPIEGENCSFGTL